MRCSLTTVPADASGLSPVARRRSGWWNRDLTARRSGSHAGQAVKESRVAGTPTGIEVESPGVARCFTQGGMWWVRSLRLAM
jgi:hypothetical protein